MNQVHDAPGQGKPRRHGLIRRFVALFSSVWLGISLLVVIFVYSSIGSALPPVRQHWLLEMTEFEFFNWWPFDALIVLMVANLTVVTVRKIPLNGVNLGVWMIHGGIVILAAGSLYYFGTKIEGDTPIFRRRLAIRIPGRTEPLHMLVRPGNRVSTGSGSDRREFEIVGIEPEFVAGDADQRGERTYAVEVGVRSAAGEFVRRLVAGDPELTTDRVTGHGRADQAAGGPLLDEQLDIRLELEPQEYVYVQDTAALYVRHSDSERWAQKPIAGLPHYHERIASADEVWMPDGRAVPVRPIALAVPTGQHDDPLHDCQVRVTGYLRYALQESRWQRGGKRLNPVCGVGLVAHGQAGEEVELVAFDEGANQAKGGQVLFRWVDSVEELDDLAAAPGATLSIRIPSDGVALDVPVARPVGEADDLPFQSIEGTQYTYRIRNVVNRLTVSSGRLEGRTISVAIVDVRKGDRSYTRWVCDLPEATRDMGPAGRGPVEMDTDLEMTFQPSGAAEVTIAAGEDPIGVQVLYNDGRGQVRRHPIVPGQQVALRDGFGVELRYLYPRARREVRPAIVPGHRRDRDARKSFSMIQVEVSQGDWSRSLWLPYNHYAMPNEQYRIPGRIAYQPKSIRLPDGRRLQLLYSRQRRELPRPVALETFRLVTFPGGLIGANSNVRDYVSMLRFADGSGNWSDPVQMSSNHPAANRGFWFFQATWDPPGRGSAGMNYTGAGVGNRNGVYVQLLGCCVAVSGMIYAFYVKPIIRRRRRQGVVDTLIEQPAAGDRLAAEEPAPAAVG